MNSLWPKGRGILVAALALTASTALAEHTRHWRQSTYEEFLKGTPKGIALRSDGRLALAPRFAPFADANASFLWALRFDAQGRLYAAGGSPAKVVRFDAEGKPSAVFESGELSAQALAFDARDNLYVATSPDGKVYRVTPQGEKSVFFDPGTKYIWDLAFAADGTLYVATGDKGQIFAVTPPGQGKIFYSTDERAVEGADRGGDQRLAGEVAGVGDQIAGGEIVGAVGDNVVARNQLERVRRREPRHMRFHRHMRIEPLNRGLRAVHLAHADVGRGVDHLPLQVRQRHRVVIDHAERADAGGGQIEQHRRAKAAGADHQHARGLELGLPRAADLAQNDVARVAFELFCIEHGFNPSA